MAEAIARQGPLDHLGLAARAVREAGAAGVWLAERPFLGKLNLRGAAASEEFAAAAKRALGAALPTQPNTAAAGRGGIAVLWLAPQEWLVVSPDGGASMLHDRLKAAVADKGGSIVDVSEARATIVVAGPRAREALAKGCPLDLHPRAFPAGACAQSLVAKAQMVLHRTDPGSGPARFELHVARSFADYLWRWLEDAGREYGVAVTGG